MKSYRIAALAVVMSLVALGCGGSAPQAKSSSEAIELSKAKTEVKAQVDYLVSQANQFINSEKFDEAVNVAKYILSDLDQNSDKAKAIMEKAKVELQKAAQGALDDAKKKLNDIKL